MIGKQIYNRYFPNIGDIDDPHKAVKVSIFALIYFYSYKLLHNEIIETIKKL